MGSKFEKDRGPEGCISYGFVETTGEHGGRAFNVEAYSNNGDLETPCCDDIEMHDREVGRELGVARQHEDEIRDKFGHIKPKYSHFDLKSGDYI
jgi:hypothetical protein